MKGPLLALAVAVSTATAQQTVPTWSISQRPTLEIGDESNTQTQFDGVTGILRMPGGEIVVANGMSQELRVFSASGAYLRTLSAQGRDQLRALNRIWRSGDTIVVSEVLPAESNVHHYSLAGYLGKRGIGAANAGGISPLDRFPDGRYVITAAPRAQRGAAAGAVFADSIPLGVISVDDLSRPRWIGWLLRESITIPGFGGRGRGRANVVPYAFGRSEHFAVSGNRLWVGNTETGAVELYGSQGNMVGQFTVPIPQRKLDTLAIRQQRATLLNDAMNWSDRARLDASYSVPLPALAPRFTRLVPGVDGEMWVELFTEDPSGPRPYVVLSRGGSAIARATIPARMTPFEMGRDYILGVQRNDDGVERVVRLSLARR